MTTSLNARIGQLIVVGFRGTELPDDAPILDAVRRGLIGGVWVCDHRSSTGERWGNIASAEQLTHLIAQLQASAGIPLLVTIDAEGGQVRRLAPEYGFSPTPSAGELGTANDLHATRRHADQLAATLRGLGVNLNLAPVVDLNRNPDNPALGRRQRCFAADPHVVLNHARAFIQAHHAAGIACSLKHFPGHGSAAGDTHVGLVDVTRTWSLDELLPYVGLFREGLADSVLTSHVILGRLDEHLPASLSRAITTELLREQMYALGPYRPADATAMLHSLAARENLTIDAGHLDRIREAGGGHSGIMYAIFQTIKPNFAFPLPLLVDLAAKEGWVREACEKLWLHLHSSERTALRSLAAGHLPEPWLLDILYKRGLITSVQTPRLFARTFEVYVDSKCD